MLCGEICIKQLRARSGTATFPHHTICEMPYVRIQFVPADTNENMLDHAKPFDHCLHPAAAKPCRFGLLVDDNCSLRDDFESGQRFNVLTDRPVDDGAAEFFSEYDSR